MNADLHQALRDEAALRAMAGAGADALALGAQGGPTGQVLDTAAAALGRAIGKALPRSFMWEGQRYRLEVSDLIARLEVKGLEGERLVLGVVQIVPR